MISWASTHYRNRRVRVPRLAAGPLTAKRGDRVAHERMPKLSADILADVVAQGLSIEIRQPVCVSHQRCLSAPLSWQRPGPSVLALR